MSRLSDYLTGQEQPNPRLEQARRALTQAIGPGPGDIASRVLTTNLVQINFADRKNALVASLARHLTE